MSDSQNITLTGTITAADLRALQAHGTIQYLSIEDAPRLTIKLAAELRHVSISHLRLRCAVTRAAMREILAINSLETLEVLDLTASGELNGFAHAASLKEFRCFSHRLTVDDMLEITRCQSLYEISAQDADLSPDVVAALATMPNLAKLDLEATNFDDDMAEQLSRSQSLRSLMLGNTPLTKRGLRAICRMTQLTELDLWATQIAEHDLDLLVQLPNLDYLSLGNTVHQGQRYNFETFVPRLTALPKLQHLWLDGIHVTPEQHAVLAQHFSNIQITLAD